MVMLAPLLSSQEKPNYAPDRIAYLQTEHFDKPLHVWLPQNYDTAKKWPVMFYYHGTTGNPTVEYLRMFTYSKDWVLVGMTYQQEGQFQHSEESLAKAITILKAVRAEVAKDVNIDFRKTYVSGFSKGGWIAGLMLQNEATFAGGMILGAGTFTPGINDHPKKIYIGIGEDDPNLAMSHRARREFAANKATEITFEIWPGLGHTFPVKDLEPNSEPMVQWLRVEAGLVKETEAIRWMESKLAHTKKSEELSPFQKLEIIERMQASPFAKILDGEGKDTLSDAIEDFQKLPETQTEQRARNAFFKVVEYESKDRYVTTLAECNAQYSKIATAFPETEYGKRAAKAVERISETLGGVK